jgi:ABC-type sugar transport system permease subunit
MNPSELVDQPARSGNTVLRILLGLALLLPAFFACIGTELVPGIGLFFASLTTSNGITKGKYIGLENYSHLFTDKPLGTALGFTLLELVVRLMLVLVVPVLLAWVVHSLGRVVRVIARVLYSIPIAIYIPVAIAIVWPLLLSPTTGYVQEALLGRQSTARLTLLAIDSLYTLGLMCGLGLIFFLPALQQPDGQGARKWIKPLLASWGFGLLATMAYSIQSFTVNKIMTNGGPADSTTNLMLYIFKVGFNYMHFGYASAISVILSMILGLLGLGAVAILVLTNVKFILVRKSEQSVPVSRPPVWVIVLAILAILLTLAVTMPGVLAFITAFARGPKSVAASAQLPGSISMGKIFVNSVLPGFISIFLIQLPIAYLGALGIGALRPLGKRSEWLLLPFGPCLFVSAGVFCVYFFPRLAQAKLLSTVPGLMSPFFINVFMLIILTLCFKGHEPRWREAVSQGKSSMAAFFKELVLPSLPLALLLGLAGLFIQMRDLLWPLVVSSQPDGYTFSVMEMSIAAMYQKSWPAIANVFMRFEVPAFIILVLVLWAFQIFYLDRLSLSGEKE